MTGWPEPRPHAAIETTFVLKVRVHFVPFEIDLERIRKNYIVSFFCRQRLENLGSAEFRAGHSNVFTRIDIEVNANQGVGFYLVSEEGLFDIGQPNYGFVRRSA
jgi:hypothetical protein